MPSRERGPIGSLLGVFLDASQLCTNGPSAVTAKSFCNQRAQSIQSNTCQARESTLRAFGYMLQQYDSRGRIKETFR
jgi:hypothetical protein